MHSHTRGSLAHTPQANYDKGGSQDGFELDLETEFSRFSSLAQRPFCHVIRTVKIHEFQCIH